MGEDWTFWADAEETGPLGRRYVGICVADNGEGMPPDVVQHAFDPFYTTKHGGAEWALVLL
jgi:signal transduction histidine kinase